MASGGKSTRGTKKPTRSDEQTELLRGIWNEMKALNSRIDRKVDELRAETRQGLDELRAETRQGFAELRSEVAELRGEVSELRAESREGLSQLGRRIDNLLLGEHGKEHAELRERVTRLEERTARLEPH
jgi:polyhydroxyalkanoate synthesis regulator phasin